MMRPKLLIIVSLLTLVSVASACESCGNKNYKPIEAEQQPQRPQKQEELEAAIKKLKADIEQAYEALINYKEDLIRAYIQAQAQGKEKSARVYLEESQVNKGLKLRLGDARNKEPTKKALTEVDFIAWEKEIQAEQEKVNAKEGTDKIAIDLVFQLKKLSFQVGKLNLQIQAKEQELAALKNK